MKTNSYSVCCHFKTSETLRIKVLFFFGRHVPRVVCTMLVCFSWAFHLQYRRSAFPGLWQIVILLSELRSVFSILCFMLSVWWNVRYFKMWIFWLASPPVVHLPPFVSVSLPSPSSLSARLKSLQCQHGRYSHRLLLLLEFHLHLIHISSPASSLFLCCTSIFIGQLPFLVVIFVKCCWGLPVEDWKATELHVSFAGWL